MESRHVRRGSSRKNTIFFVSSSYRPTHANSWFGIWNRPYDRPSKYRFESQRKCAFHLKFERISPHPAKHLSYLDEQRTNQQEPNVYLSATEWDNGCRGMCAVIEGNTHASNLNSGLREKRGCAWHWTIPRTFRHWALAFNRLMNRFIIYLIDRCPRVEYLYGRRWVWGRS